MILQIVHHDPTHGFSPQSLPDLDSAKTLVLLFGAPEYHDDPAPIQAVARAYPNSHLIGCSTSGEIFGTRIFDHSISIAVARFDGASLRTAMAPAGEGQASRAAGVSLGKQLCGPDLRGAFVLSDGLHVNGSELVAGLSSVLPASVPISGGLAGDGDRFKRTWVIKDGMPQTGWISAVGLYGDGLCLGHGSRGGWDIFGPPRLVTRSVGNVVFELDGQPALLLYKKYLGELASGLPATGLLFPLALLDSGSSRSNRGAGEVASAKDLGQASDPAASAGDGRSVVRTILAVDEAQQSLTFAGDVPQGSRAQLMRANFDRLIDGAAGAGRLIKSDLPAGAPALAIAVSCVGRRLVLNERTEEEVEATLEALPAQTQQIGFYSYGELSPQSSGPCTLHNQTMTLTTLGEA